MSTKRALAILIPIVSFLLGVFAQVLFDQWIASSNVLLMSIAVIIIALVTIFVILEYLEKRFDIFDNRLLRIADSMGLHAEYIEDNHIGTSYTRSAELVEQAQNSLLFVAQWEPNYIVGNVDVNTNTSPTPVFKARQRFYDAISKQAILHKSDAKQFYSRIVTVPHEYMNKRIPFEADPNFYKHLISIAKLNTYSCVLRKTDISINMPFTIIDDRRIIITILESAKNVRQARHGTLFLDEPQGKLINSLKSMYLSLEKHASPIEFTLDELLAETSSYQRSSDC